MTAKTAFMAHSPYAPIGVNSTRRAVHAPAEIVAQRAISTPQGTVRSLENRISFLENLLHVSLAVTMIASFIFSFYGLGAIAAIALVFSLYLSHRDRTGNPQRQNTN